MCDISYSGLFRGFVQSWRPSVIPMTNLPRVIATLFLAMESSFYITSAQKVWSVKPKPFHLWYVRTWEYYTDRVFKSPIVPKSCDIDPRDRYNNNTWITHPPFSLIFGSIRGIKANTHDSGGQLATPHSVRLDLAPTADPTRVILLNGLYNHGFLLHYLMRSERLEWEICIIPGGQSIPSGLS